MYSIVTLGAVLAAPPVQSRDLCRDLKYAIGESKKGYPHTLGSRQVVLGSGDFQTDGFSTSITIGDFDTCSISRSGLTCLGQDTNGEPEELEPAFEDTYRQITLCLQAKTGVEHGWRVSRPFKSESTGDSLVVYTDAGHYDGDGRLLHISLQIEHKVESNLRYLLLELHYYDASSLSDER